MLKIIGIVYVTLVIGLFIEAYFYTELDPESKKELKSREKWQQEE